MTNENRAHSAIGGAEPASAVPSSVPRLARLLLPWTAAAAFAYFGIVLLLDRRVWGVQWGVGQLALLVVILSAGSWGAMRWTLARFPGAATAFLSVALMLGVAVCCMLIGDTVVSARFAAAEPVPTAQMLGTSDSTTLAGELLAHFYYPTAHAFRVYKPGVTTSADDYGLMYVPGMLKSPTLHDSVLHLHHVTTSISPEGLRSSHRIEQCHVAALGDSFTYGAEVTDGATWPDLLEGRIGECVLNFGIFGAGPMEEFEAFRYHMRLHEGRAQVRVILWSFYEGNDLEDSYADTSLLPKPPALKARISHATIIGGASEFVHSIQGQSWLRQLLDGSLRRRTAQPPNAGTYVIDGVRLGEPLFHSPVYGYVLSYRKRLDTAAAPLSYVMNHPNRPRLDRLFSEMAAYADSLHAHVYVLLMPTLVREYADAFPWSPAPSPEPYLLDYVAGLAHRNGFQTIDLLTEFKPFAKDSLLYFRDDDHLNPYGHQVTAALIARRLEADGQAPLAHTGK